MTDYRTLERLQLRRDSMRHRIEALDEESFNLEAELSELDREISRVAKQIREANDD